MLDMLASQALPPIPLPLCVLQVLYLKCGARCHARLCCSRLRPLLAQKEDTCLQCRAECSRARCPDLGWLTMLVHAACSGVL